MVLRKLPVPGRPTNLDKVFALELGAGGGCLNIFSNLSQRAVKPKTGSAWMVRRCWINFQCLGVLPI